MEKDSTAPPQPQTWKNKHTWSNEQPNQQGHDKNYNNQSNNR